MAFTELTDIVAIGDELEASVVASIYTDKLADKDDELPDGSKIRRGYWARGDWGSKLWLLDRSKITQATLNAIKDYLEDSLQWMIDDEIADEVIVPIPVRSDASKSGVIYSVSLIKNNETIFQKQWDEAIG